MNEEQIGLILKEYMSFMKIDTFPDYEIQDQEIKENSEYIHVAAAEYDLENKKHILHIPKDRELPKYIYFHEFTHILDASKYNNHDINHDRCLTGYMEYHASQVEFRYILGAKALDDSVVFTMETRIGTDWTVKTYLDNKLNTAKKLITKDDKNNQIDGINALFNFFGIRSICYAEAKNYTDDYTYEEFLNHMTSYLFFTIKDYMLNIKIDVEKVVALYSNAIYECLK